MAEFLVDKSAFNRRDTPTGVQAVLEPLLLAGRLATCAIVDLELLFSARTPSGYKSLGTALQGMPRVPMNEAVMERALEVQAALARKAMHRSVPLPDLLIAACAEHHGLVVMHYDADFDRIAAITKQPTRWVVRRGSVS